MASIICCLRFACDTWNRQFIRLWNFLKFSFHDFRVVRVPIHCTFSLTIFCSCGGYGALYIDSPLVFFLLSRILKREPSKSLLPSFWRSGYWCPVSISNLNYLSRSIMPYIGLESHLIFYFQVSIHAFLSPVTWLFGMLLFHYSWPSLISLWKRHRDCQAHKGTRDGAIAKGFLLLIFFLCIMLALDMDLFAFSCVGETGDREAVLHCDIDIFTVDSMERLKRSKLCPNHLNSWFIWQSLCFAGTGDETNQINISLSLWTLVCKFLFMYIFKFCKDSKLVVFCLLF